MNTTGKPKKKILPVLSGIIIILAVVCFFLVIVITDKVKKNIIIEAGSPVPNIELFFSNSKTAGSFVTDVSAINTNTVGKIPIELEINGKIYKSSLTIQDTIPPEGTSAEKYIFKGNSIEAEELTDNIKDATTVVCSFVSPPDLDKPGWQDITVTLTDKGNNTAKVESRLYIFEVKDELKIEAGIDADTITVEDFILNYIDSDTKVKNGSMSVSFPDGSVDTSVIGSVAATLTYDGFSGKSVVTVEDTIPPEGKATEKHIFKGNSINADDFVIDIHDETQVICEFASPPDFDKPGWQDINIALIDEGNNTTNIKSRLYVFEIKDELKIEAGIVLKQLTAEDFILNYIDIGDDEKKPEGSGVLSVSFPDGSIDTSVIGSVAATLTYDGFSGKSVVIVEDTIPPEGKATEQYIFKGNNINAKDFISDIRDATAVTCTFTSPLDLNKSGWQDINIALTDKGQNTTNIKSRLYIFELKDELQVELGTASGKIQAKDFILNYIEVSGLSLIFPGGNLNTSVAGSGSVTVRCGKYQGKSSVKITDTTPPTANVKNCQVLKGEQIAASAFASNIQDYSSVTVRYKQQPDFSSVGTQSVYLILEDAYKNTAEYTAQLTIIVDTTPPSISGTLNKSVLIGGSVAYRNGITVTDDYDFNVALVIDNSQVNLSKEGSYTVFYSATDKSGNKAQVSGTITVYTVTIDLVNEMADDILAKIVTADMSQYNKANAIYKWVNSKMKYSATSSARNLAQRAYDCFTKGTGDCYTYMAASKILLNRAGIQNAEVSRSGGTTPHYWNLVNTGGGWYHFDVCPTPRNAVTINQRFMFSESQAEQYTNTIGMSYYVYNKSTVPEVVE